MTEPNDYADLLAGLGSDDLDDFNFEESSQASSNDHEACGRSKIDNDEDDPFSSDPFTSGNTLPVVAFSTARGHTLPPPSESSIARAKQLLEGPEREQEIPATASAPKRRKVEEVPTSLFTTGGGRSITPPSREAFDKAASSLDLESDPIYTTPRPGFTTGSGHSLPPPPSSAQAAVSRLFGDMDPTSVPTLGASRNPVAVNSTIPSSTTDTLDHTSVEAISTPRIKLPTESDCRDAKSKSNSVGLSLSPEHAVFMLASPFRSPLVGVRTPLQTTTNTGSTPLRTQSIDIKGPTRRLGSVATPSSDKKAAKKFVTPFKNPQVARMQRTNRQVTPLRSPTASRDVTVFDLQKPLSRQTMREAFLKPQYYSPGESRELGIPDVIWSSDLENATKFEFTAEGFSVFNRDTALKFLLQDGCRSVSAKWVSNHWPLILWKIAGQIQAQPNLFDQKWNGGEVIQQLKYRYEREYGAAQRPIIRKIQEHDASAAGPMVLCVTRIHWPTSNDSENEARGQANPYLELTDGWYRIQAESDDCLSRAVRRLKITVGRKLAIAGAKLESTTDGTDVLDALHKSRIKINGNSCHSARWDARSGAHEPFVASSASISVDGGMINSTGSIIQKLYPVAFVRAGQSDALWEPPWNEEEEAIRCDQWKEAYMNEMSLRNEELRRSMGALQDFVSLLESNAEEVYSLDGTISEEIDEVFEKLFSAKDPTVQLRQSSGPQIVQSTKYGKARLDDELEAGRRQIERDIQVACPPRQVRRFRMARVVDMSEGVRQPFREGMLNIWDATDVGSKEGGKYFVSNVYPGRSGDWSIPKSIGVKKEVYLHTRKDTRWHFVA